MPEVEAKAQKATFGSYAVGPAPKSGKAALTKSCDLVNQNLVAALNFLTNHFFTYSAKTYATTGSMCEVDAKAEKFLASSTPPYHVFAKEKTPKSGMFKL